MKISFFFHLFVSLPAFLIGVATAEFLLGNGRAEQTERPIVLKAHTWPTIFNSAYEQTHASPRVSDGPTDMIFFSPSTEQIDVMLAWIKSRQHLQYIPEANDCDDIAFEWRVLAHRWAIENATYGAPVSFCAFIAYVKIYPGAFDGAGKTVGFHALGLVRDSEGVFWWVEPTGPLKVKVLEAYYENTIEAVKIVW